MIFKSLVGNRKTATSFAEKIKNGKLGHAFIIEGDAGSGKHTLAMEICKALFCECDGVDFPCNLCRGCNITSNGYNTDIYTLSKGDKAQISVDSIRDMLSSISYKPDSDRYKVYVIEAAEKMNVQAQNALLLSLEEPPEYVIFLLLCTDASMLLETVRSRAQTVRMERFSADFAASYLRENYANQSEEKIISAASVSAGSLGTAIEALEAKHSVRTDLAAEASDFIEAFLDNSLANRILYANSLKYSREEFSLLFDFVQSGLRDLIAAKAGNSEYTFYADPLVPAALSGKHNIRKIMRLYDAVDTARRDICQYNGSVSAVMTSLAAEK